MHSTTDYAPFSIMTDFIIHNLHYKRGWGGGRAYIIPHVQVNTSFTNYSNIIILFYSIYSLAEFLFSAQLTIEGVIVQTVVQFNQMLIIYYFKSK